MKEAMQFTGSLKHKRKGKKNKKFLGSMAFKSADGDSDDSFMDAMERRKDEAFNIGDEELEHLKRTKYAPLLMNEMQQKCIEQAKRLKAIAEECATNNAELRDEIYDIENELDKIDQEK